MPVPTTPLTVACATLKADPRFLVYASREGYKDFVETKGRGGCPFESFVEFMINTGVQPPFYEIDGGDWSCTDLVPEAVELCQLYADAYTAGQWDAFDND